MNSDQDKAWLLQKITEVTDEVSDISDDIEALAQAGKMETLYQTALALEEDTDTLLMAMEQNWLRAENAASLQQWIDLGFTAHDISIGIIEGVFGRIFDVISSTPGLSAVETAFKLLQIQRKSSAQSSISDLEYSAKLAVCFASAQPLPVLLAIFERYADEESYKEFLNCLLQETIIRGEHLEHIPVIRRFHQRLQEQHHPFAWLPRVPTSIETQLFLPSYKSNTNGYSTSASSARWNISPLSPEEMEETIPVFVETSSDSQSERIKAAVLGWRWESDGSSEARTFIADIPCIKHISPKILLSLPLKCLAGTLPTDIIVYKLTPAEAFRKLFGAAAYGGAYMGGHLGAWGRLKAWQSLSGLVGADPHASSKQVIEQALHCQWYSFITRSPWFCQMGWDLTLIALQPDRRSLAVLAATDID